MTRRLVLSIIGVTLAALFLAGAVTLGLARIESRRSTESRLRAQVTDLAQGLVEARSSQTTTGATGTTDATVTAGVLATVRRVLRLDGIAIVVVGPGGRTLDTLPAGVESTDVERAVRAPGTAVSGHRGKVFYAASAIQVRNGSTAVMLATSGVDNTLGPAARWFLWAAMVVVIVAALVALALARRLIRPLHQLEVTAHRIAAGDLSARAPEPQVDDLDELAQLSRAVNQMAGSLQRSKAVEEQFLMSVSHDLRTPLTSIRGYAEAIADGAVSDPAAAGEIIGSEAVRLDRLVRDLLELAKMRSTGFSLQNARLDAAHVVTNVVAGQQPKAAAHGLQLRVDAAAAAPINGDADRLGQVVANLIDNALKFARTTVWVGARVDPATATVTVWVDDDGPGIAPADLPHVFERLYVSKHQPSRAESSSGLGLAIVAELVTAMSGRVEAQVAPTGGARMVAHFPLAR